MASADLREELNCSICLEVYSDPVTLRCGHNFCKSCINQTLDSQEESGFYTCPECRKRFRLRPLTKVNTTLRNIAERFHSSQSDAANIEVFCTFCDLPTQAVKTCLQCETSMCERHLQNHNRSLQHILIDPTGSLENRKCFTHKKILEYYCTEDSSFLCAICESKNDHQGHQVETLDKALEKVKDRLRKDLEKVISKTEETEKQIQNLKEDVQKVQGKADAITKGINEQIREVRRQLKVLEKTLISNMLLKKEEILRPKSDLLHNLEKDKEELLMSRRRIQELCDMTDPFQVLQEEKCWAFQDVRSCVHPHRPGEVMDEGPISRTLQEKLMDITLGVNMCFYMQEPTKLLMDVTTASKNVTLSADLRSATYTPIMNQTLQETPRRFQNCQVLNFRSFCSGRHYWDVETSNVGKWRIGVCYPSMARSGDGSNIGYNSKSWCLQGFNNQLLALHNGSGLKLPHVSSCNNVRVYLDYEAGQLSFYERGDTMRRLHIFTARFTEPLHAAFMVHESWVRIKTDQTGLPSYFSFIPGVRVPIITPPAPNRAVRNTRPSPTLIFTNDGHLILEPQIPDSVAQQGGLIRRSNLS